MTPRSSSTSFLACAMAAVLMLPGHAPRDVRTATFSIAAYDPDTGDFGVAVCTFPTRVGAICPWARAGVGAIATQALANAGFGPRGLEMLAAGRSAEETIEALLHDDPQREERQIGIVDSRGHAAAYTGSRCMDWAGHIVGDHYTVQGNILVSRATLEAMQRAFTTARDDRGRAIPFAERILRALEAGYEAGGDRRGHRSAAILVVRRNVWDQEGYDRLVDVRVDDHENPVVELRRIMYRRDALRWNLGERVVERPRGTDILNAARILRRLGYLEGEPSDLFTDAFGDALARFRRDWGLPAGERLDSAAAAALREADGSGPPLLAGAACEDITPSLDGGPVWLAGFRPGRRATAVHDRLYARALVLRRGGETVGFVALDLVGFLRRDVLRARVEASRRTGIPPERIVVASTHTHSGPDTIGLWGPLPLVSGVDGEYLDRVVGAIARAVERAHANVRRVRVRFATADGSDLVRDSREPDVRDPTARAMLFDAPEGPIAIVTVFSCHPEVLDSHNTQVTSDYAGYLREELERRYEGAMAIFFAGAIGGMQTPQRGETGATFETAERLGRALAERCAAALDAAEPADVRAIEFRRREAVIPLENPRFRAAMEAGLFGEPAETVERDGGGIRVRTEMALVGIGPIRILAMPGEVFPELAQEWERAMPGPHRVLIGLANDELGYILPRASWREGEYEETMSVGPAAGEVLTEAVRALAAEEF